MYKSNICEGQISFEKVELSVVDPDYINIMITGHQHCLFKNLEEILSLDNVQKIAKKAGAKGFKIVGCTCEEQGFLVRRAGCIDLVISELDGTLPDIELICKSVGIPRISIDDVAKKCNAELIPFFHENKEGIAAIVIVTAVASYTEKRAKN